MVDGPTAPPFIYVVPFLTAGNSATFSFSGAVPLSSTYLLYSLNGAGPTNTIVGPLDLSNPIKVMRELTADRLGNGSVALVVPLAASGRTLYTQAATLPAGQVSNSFAMPVN